MEQGLYGSVLYAPNDGTGASRLANRLLWNGGRLMAVAVSNRIPTAARVTHIVRS